MFKVVFEITKGSWKNSKFYFDEKGSRIIGRSNQCNFSLPDDYTGVSSQHCRLDIDPPVVIVNDLNSTNGTYLNDTKIGQRSNSYSMEESKRFLMRSGDQLRLGNNCDIRLRVEYPDYCARHSCDYRPRPNNSNPPCSACDTKLDGLYKQFAGYIFLTHLGKGSMGEVWLMQDILTGEKLAMKFIHPEQLADGEEDIMITNWFQREMGIVEQIEYKRIVKYYKSGQDSDSLYILMEYCRGGNLSDFIRRDDLKHIFRNNSEEALKERIKIATHIILQVLDGLDYIHNAKVEMTSKAGTQTVKGLVHRDLKPENILLADISLYPDVKIGDFGLAKSYQLAGLTKQTPTPDKIYAGDTRFIPIQQIINYRYVKPDVDVWAAAAIYYYMITGVAPKDGLKGNKTDAIPIRKRDPRIPEKLAAVIDKALIDIPKIGIRKAKTLRNAIAKILK